MRHPLKRALAIGTLAALAASSAAGWTVAAHLADDDHHAGDPRHRGGAIGLEMALHGHAHPDGTAPHAHPVLASIAASLPGKVLVHTVAIAGDAHQQVFVGPCDRHSLSRVGPTHDRPPRVDTVAILRI